MKRSGDNSDWVEKPEPTFYMNDGPWCAKCGADVKVTDEECFYCGQMFIRAPIKKVKT